MLGAIAYNTWNTYRQYKCNKNLFNNSHITSLIWSVIHYKPRLLKIEQILSTVCTWKRLEFG